MNINMDDLMNALVLMGQGMAGIFIVLVVISLIVVLLTKLTAPKSKDDK